MKHVFSNGVKRCKILLEILIRPLETDTRTFNNMRRENVSAGYKSRIPLRAKKQVYP